MYWFADEKPDLDNNKLVKWLRGHMNISTAVSYTHLTLPTSDLV